MSFVYILKGKNNKYYIGSTVDLQKRIKHHKNGGTPTTKRFSGVDLVFSQKYENINDARSIERKLKKLKRRDYIKKIIEDGFIKIKP